MSTPDTTTDEEPFLHWQDAPFDVSRNQQATLDALSSTGAFISAETPDADQPGIRILIRVEVEDDEIGGDTFAGVILPSGQLVGSFHFRALRRRSPRGRVRKITVPGLWMLRALLWARGWKRTRFPRS